VSERGWATLAIIGLALFTVTAIAGLLLSFKPNGRTSPAALRVCIGSLICFGAVMISSIIYWRDTWGTYH
jgi:hypothetical protein